MGKKEVIFEPRPDHCDCCIADIHKQDVSFQLSEYIPTNDFQ